MFTFGKSIGLKNKLQHTVTKHLVRTLLTFKYSSIDPRIPISGQKESLYSIIDKFGMEIQYLDICNPHGLSGSY